MLFLNARTALKAECFVAVALYPTELDKSLEL